MKQNVQAFFDPATWTVTYVVHDDASCAIVDSVLDYDPKSGRTSTASADKVIAFVRSRGLKVEWILETHAHADHLSAAPYLRKELGGRIAIGEQIRAVQGVFKKVFNLEPEFRLDGSQFDHLFADGEAFRIGELAGEAMHVPGHTPADMAYRIGDAVFVGDTLFMPDVGTARCDFPGGDARTLYRSVRRLLGLPGGTRLFMCHPRHARADPARHPGECPRRRAAAAGGGRPLLSQDSAQRALINGTAALEPALLGAAVHLRSGLRFDSAQIIRFHLAPA